MVKYNGIDSLSKRQEFKPGQTDYSLASISSVLEFFGNPQDSIPCIHITGSNGKGSTSAMLASMLGAAGFHVSLFSSPHLQFVNERIRIDGHSIKDELLDSALNKIVEAEALLKLELSYFEMITAAFYLISRELQVDYAVVEVGLGGRLDATNVLKKPLCTAITTISLEHTNILGNSVQDIAREKAGIIKPASPCFLGKISDQAELEIRRYAKEQGSEAISSEEQILPTNELNLKGLHQIPNAKLATCIADFLKIPKDAQSRGLKQVHWPARLETVLLSDSKKFIFDAAHNLEGFQALKAYLQNDSSYQITMITGFLNSAPWKDMFSLIAEHPSKVIVLQIDSFRAEDAKEVCKYIEKTFPDIQVEHAGRDFEKVCSHISSGDTPTLVAGSMYMIADVRNFLHVEEVAVWERSG